MKQTLTVIAATVYLLLAAGTAASALAPLPASQYPYFADDLQLQGLQAALEQSLAYLRSVPAATCYNVAGSSLPAQRLIESVLFFQKLLEAAPTAEQLNQQIQNAYSVYRLDNRPSGKTRRMLITGYYQPIFKGSLERKPPYLHPLYGVPNDLAVRRSGGKKPTIGRMQDGGIVPFWTRKELETGDLLRGQELGWLQDPFDAFVLHVQGSGVLQLPDGTVRGVHYAQSNGREYRSIGKYLVETGRMQLAEVNMDSLRQYLVDHPEEREMILHQNDSFIFFHWSQPGPAIGSLGRPLTAGRSIATDQQWYPPGALVFLDSRRPVMADGQVVEWKKMQRFVSVQDTGSALTGPGRVDVFWGSGEAAGTEAGRMKEEGNVFLLVLNQNTRLEQ